ncbi:competence type IV pilus assembly protein ComGB [Caldibacillus lycopersici]|uniref:Competence type IV pilus assembly protein ComGB n=1 Tax=Perspicuibacillus lycopersici TaxID=1325689 RepID=A0AAE3ISW8_9BACI|nr:competence type IV pilus assembly protein ComGB [Perspicuibacillus lycopersici]MCU9613861.1 competence type IV pilus assembly protein ComGB [Perspicuibacillus lycopersici]
MRKRRWSIHEQALLFQRLGLLLQQGYTLSEAIDFMIIQLDKEKSSALTTGVEQLKTGERFYKVLSNLKFHPTAVSFVYYGEENGQLAFSLKTTGELLQKRENDEGRLKNLLAYPLFLLMFTAVLFFVIQWKLLPQFLQLYNSFQTEPSMFIRFMVWQRNHPVLILLVLLVITAIYLVSFTIFKEKKSPYELQCLFAKIPMFGPIYRLWHTYYISFQISQLLTNGISLHDALKFISKDPKKKYLYEAINQINADLLNGESLYSAVKRIPLWQKELAIVVLHGQLSGKLDIELKTYSEICFQQFSERIEKLINIIQPLIFTLLAVWLIVLYMSIMMPSFQMINKI